MGSRICPPCASGRHGSCTGFLCACDHREPETQVDESLNQARIARDLWHERHNAVVAERDAAEREVQRLRAVLAQWWTDHKRITERLRKELRDLKDDEPRKRLAESSGICASWIEGYGGQRLTCVREPRHPGRHRDSKGAEWEAPPITFQICPNCRDTARVTDDSEWRDFPPFMLQRAESYCRCGFTKAEAVRPRPKLPNPMDEPVRPGSKETHREYRARMDRELHALQERERLRKRLVRAGRATLAVIGFVIVWSLAVFAGNSLEQRIWPGVCS